jgi:hypothetical protein
MLLLAALGTAQACVVNGRLFSSSRSERVIQLEATGNPGDRQKRPEIVFRTDGNDVVASIKVVANGSPHALMTSYQTTDNVVTLRYCLMQNSDRLVRSVETVTIEWRLKDFAILPSPMWTYRVEAFSMAASSQELKCLIPQLQSLIAAPAPADTD